MKRKCIIGISALLVISICWVVIGSVISWKDTPINYMGMHKDDVLKVTFEKSRRVCHNRIRMTIRNSRGKRCGRSYQKITEAKEDEALMNTDVWEVNFRFRGCLIWPKEYLWGRTYFDKLTFRDNKVVEQKQGWILE